MIWHKDWSLTGKTNIFPRKVLTSRIAQMTPKSNTLGVFHGTPSIYSGSYREKLTQRASFLICPVPKQKLQSTRCLLQGITYHSWTCTIDSSKLFIESGTPFYIPFSVKKRSFIDFFNLNLWGLCSLAFVTETGEVYYFDTVKGDVSVGRHIVLEDLRTHPKVRWTLLVYV